MALYTHPLCRDWSPPSGRRRHTKSGFGTQIISHRVTSPAFGFGSSARSDAEKVFLHTLLVAACKHSVHTVKKNGFLALLRFTDLRRFYRRFYKRFTEDFIWNTALAPCDCFFLVSLPRAHRITDFVWVKQMYINAELAKQQVDKCSPGPQYEALSSFGKQPKSYNENPPEIHFPVGSRWFRRRREEEPPGPGTYNRKSGFLTQFAPSRQKSPEGALFGTSTRKQQDNVYLSVEFDKAKYGTLSPGPSAYGAPSTFGPQATSPNRTAPFVGFIHDKRFKYHLLARAGETTGPGQYDAKGSLGKQDEAYKDTLPSYTFQKSTRDNANKVFISMEHDKVNFGVQSPGPAILKLKGCMGIQASSRNRNPAFFRFGKGLRWEMHPDEAPGPGTYDC